MDALSSYPGILPDDPIAPLLDAMAERDARMEALVRELRDKLDGARGLTPEAERELVQRVAREVRVGLAALPRAHLLRTGLLGAALLVSAMALAGGAAYAVGHSKGGDTRVAELCQGAAVREQPKGGTACTFWLVSPGGKS